MSSDASGRALVSASERCGIEPRFWTMFGQEQAASPETLKAILGALGVRTESEDTVAADVQRREREEWVHILSPAIVTTYSHGQLTIPVTFPEAELGTEARFTVTLESGGVLKAKLPLSSGAVEERRTFEDSWARVRVTLPLEVPLGYHRLAIDAGWRHAETNLIVAPASAWQPEELKRGGKTSGFAVALYGLRSERNWGFGDFTDLQRLCKWAARELGVSFIALNPLHAIPNRRPYNTSPYLPTSIFFQNYLYLDIEAIEEWKQSRRAQWCFQRPSAQSELRALRDAETVEYERIAAFKTRFLKLLFAEFLRRHWRKDTARAHEFRKFRDDAGNLLTRFGLYCALNEYLHRRDPNLWVWTNWPAEYRDPESAATKKFAAKHWRSILFYEWAAWQTDQQLADAQRAAVDAGLSIGLYHDLALATDRFGADIWAHRDFFAHGCRVGSPPDDFSPQGQDWGFPPPNTLRHRADGYRMFRESIRRTAQHGGALRIDHVMRFFRLYWIPDGMDATKGAYVHDRAEDLVRILALESARSRILIVGEDLGTVEPYIREMLGRFGILSYRLFYFERSGDGAYRRADEYPRQALVSSSTHDLPTLAGFWKGSDIEARKAAGVLDAKAYDEQWTGRRRDKERMLEALRDAGLLPRAYAAKVDFDDTLHRAIMAFLASTPSMIMLVNQEDLTREPHQQNLPGTTSQYPNWGRKMRFTIEQLESDRQAREWTAQLCEQLHESGRAEATAAAARS